LLLARAEQLGLDGSIRAEAIDRVILGATTDLGDDPTDGPDGGANWDGHGRVDFLAAVQQIGPELVTAPRAPVRMTVNAAGPGAVELGWTDRSDNEQGFVIERAERNNGVLGPFAPIAEVDRNVTSYTDDSAESGVTYVYRVAAFNVTATSGARRAVIVTPP
jgi:hypothetical protein